MMIVKFKIILISSSYDLFSRVYVRGAALSLSRIKIHGLEPKRSEPTILQIQKKRNTIQQVTTVYMYVHSCGVLVRLLPCRLVRRQQKTLVLVLL